MIRVSPESPSVRLVEGEWYVRSDLVAALEKQVLVDGRSFVVSDVQGDFPAHVRGELGYFWRGTRHLSVLEVFLANARPLLLSSSVSDDGRELAIELTNRDISRRGQVVVPRDVVHVRRRVALEGEALEVELVVSNHHTEALAFDIGLDLEADFADIFEIRGNRRNERGQERPPQALPNGLRFSYRGLDAVERTTTIEVFPPPASVRERALSLMCELGRGERKSIFVRVRASHGDAPAAPRPSFSGQNGRTRAAARAWDEGSVRFRSSSSQVERALQRSVADLGLLMQATPDGSYPLAGIPWYGTPFGRDGLIASLELLPWRPDVARSVLRYLAKHRARKDDAFTDAEPGKVLHEIREGEMAALREVPFVPYYGTADATPLWLVVMDEYLAATGDLELANELWEAIEEMVGWIDGPGDGDGDGFIEYARRSPLGLTNQGWKDSSDSIHHQDGTLAEGPIALVEVQGYAYAARRAFARLLRARSQEDRARAVDARAEELRGRLDAAFWDEGEGSYALALDGRKRACRSVTSNAGHLLFTQACSVERARRVAERLFAEDMQSGYGVRTLSSRSPRYNPMSYHNGSVWPHDTALIALGLRRYGDVSGAATLLDGLLAAATGFSLGRIPELFCGFARGPSTTAPVPYPVACSPQAWSAGALLLALRAALGLEIDGACGRLTLENPTLPQAVDWLEIRSIRVGAGEVDLVVRRGVSSCAVEILDRRGPVEVVIRGRSTL